MIVRNLKCDFIYLKQNRIFTLGKNLPNRKTGSEIGSGSGSAFVEKYKSGSADQMWIKNTGCI
jgi:hypothetical protein